MRIKNKLFCTVQALPAIVLLASAVYAEAPNLFTYQGRLKEGGQAVSGNRTVEIKLCPVETAGVCETTGAQSVAVSNGLFRSTFTIPAAVNFGTGNWWLEIKVGADTLAPRERLTSNAYSLFSATAAYAENISAATGSDGVYISSNLYVTGGKYYGDGSQLQNLPVSGGAVAKTGDAMTGQLTLYGSTLTVGGNAFSVGGGAFKIASGRIGIGTVAPSGILEINGTDNPQLLLTDLSGDVTFAMRYSNGAPRHILGVPYYNDRVVLTNKNAPFPSHPDSSVILWDSGVTTLQMGTGGYLSFVAGTATEKARFTPQGNFGIGTTAPLYRLVVSSAAGEAGNMLVISTGTSDVIRLTGAGEIYANYYYGDGSGLTGVTATSIPDGSVTSAKIADANVTDAKIAGMSASKLTGALPAIDGSALTSVTATIADGSVTLAKMANMATASLLGRNTAGAGVPEVLAAATVKTILSLTKGDVGLASVTDEAQIAKIIGTSKGDVIAFSAAGTPANLAVGANGNVFMADSAQLAGVKWAALTKSDIGLGNVDNVQQLPMSYLDTDNTLAADSDSKVASQKAIKAFVATGLSGKLSPTGDGSALQNIITSTAAIVTTLGVKYDAVNFVAGTNYLTPTGNGSGLTGVITSTSAIVTALGGKVGLSGDEAIAGLKVFTTTVSVNHSVLVKGNYSLMLSTNTGYGGGLRHDQSGSETMVMAVRNASSKIYLATGYDVSPNAGGALALPSSPEITIYNGMVGIKDTTPNSELDVTGQVNATGGLCIGGNCKTSWASIDNLGDHTATQALNMADRPINSISTASLNGIIISSGTGNNYFAGNVGIGIASPTDKLNVLGGNVVLEKTSGDMLLVVKTGASANSAEMRLASNNLAWSIGHSGDATSHMLSFQYYNGAWSTPAVLTTDGKFGIGTNAPANPLEVNGVIKSLTGGFTFPDGTNMTTAAGVGTGYASVADVTMAADTDANGAGILTFATKGSERMRVDNDGNVGVGLAAPATRLDVQAAVADVYAQIWRNSAGVIVSSMNSAGVVYADGSGIRNISVSGDDLGNHTATQNLAMGVNNITMTGSLGATGNRLTKGWFTDLEVTNAIAGSITGNAGTVTTNANLTGVVTSVGNATSIGNSAITNAMLANTAVANLSGTNTGDQTTVSGNAGTVTNGVYTIGDQTIGGIKTFSSTILGGISGNAATVTNGVYTSGNQTVDGTKTFSSAVVAKGYASSIQSETFTGTMTSFVANGSGIVMLTQSADTNPIATITGCDSGTVAQGQQVLFIVSSYVSGALTFTDTSVSAIAADNMVLGGSWSIALGTDAGSTIVLACTTINSVKAWVEVSRLQGPG